MFYNEKRRGVSYEVEQQVFISTTNIILNVQGGRKLLP